jgi:hypothetical protein
MDAVRKLSASMVVDEESPIAIASFRADCPKYGGKEGTTEHSKK